MQKVMVISGATSGIGKACAEKFASEGYKVYCLSRNAVKNFPFEFVKCDVTNGEQVQSAVAEIISKEQNIDVVVCNAGNGISGALESFSLEDAKAQFDLNLFGAFNLAKAFVPQLRSQGYGKIIFMSSVGAIFPLPFQALYSASKNALETMVYAWREELKPFNIQLSCILPGDTKTNFTSSRQKLSDNEFYKERDRKSVEKMEKDEMKGDSPEKVANIVFKVAKKKKMPPRKIVGFQYKFLALLGKMLPQKLVLWIVGKIYG